MKRHIDRRQFLAGVGGSVLALPMLEFFNPRQARAAPTAPKRLLIITHHNGRAVGDGRANSAGGTNDWWRPRTTTGPLPAGMSKMLVGLDDLRDEIVTIDGVDNVMRHTTGDLEGHLSSQFTYLTGFPQVNPNRSGGPSLDYVAGLRLRPSTSMEASLCMPVAATPQGVFFSNVHHFTDSGSATRVISGCPQLAISDLFANFKPPDPPPAPTLTDRLHNGRKSVLDAVAAECAALRKRLNARDRDQLDRYTSFIQSTEQKLSGGGGTVVTQGCAPPDPANAPHVMPQTWDEYTKVGRNADWERGHQDALTVPFQVETLVQAFACDITRVMCLDFDVDSDFAREYPTNTPFADYNAFHTKVHSVQRPAEQPQNSEDLHGAYQHFSWVTSMVIKRLAAFTDIDGNRLLDNTLVLWSSALGYGADHLNNDLPIVLAGMKGAFPKGQNRHLVCSPRRTMGDLCAHILRMLGGTDQTFGETGFLGAAAAKNGVTDLLPALNGIDGYINANTPLHNGPLDL